MKTYREIATAVVEAIDMMSNPDNVKEFPFTIVPTSVSYLDRWDIKRMIHIIESLHQDGDVTGDLEYNASWATNKVIGIAKKLRIAQAKQQASEEAKEVIEQVLVNQQRIEGNA
jgi:hypothetical protein